MGNVVEGRGPPPLRPEGCSLPLLVRGKSNALENTNIRNGTVSCEGGEGWYLCLE